MNSQVRPLNDLTHEAIALLTKELGLVDTLRFLGQFSGGHGNYTLERDELFGDLTLEQLSAAMKEPPKTSAA